MSFSEKNFTAKGFTKNFNRLMAALEKKCCINNVFNIAVGNGLHHNDDVDKTIYLGGPLVEDTEIETGDFSLKVTNDDDAFLTLLNDGSRSVVGVNGVLAVNNEDTPFVFSSNERIIANFGEVDPGIHPALFHIGETNEISNGNFNFGPTFSIFRNAVYSAAGTNVTEIPLNQAALVIKDHEFQGDVGFNLGIFIFDAIALQSNTFECDWHSGVDNLTNPIITTPGFFYFYNISNTVLKNNFGTSDHSSRSLETHQIRFSNALSETNLYSKDGEGLTAVSVADFMVKAGVTEAGQNIGTRAAFMVIGDVLGATGGNNFDFYGASNNRSFFNGGIITGNNNNVPAFTTTFEPWRFGPATDLGIPAVQLDDTKFITILIGDIIYRLAVVKDL